MRNNFNELLSEINRYLKLYGFYKKGYFFIKTTSAFYQIINFQKIKNSTEYYIFFKINICVVSKKVLDYKGLIFQNNLMHNQWECRIQNLLENESFDWLRLPNSHIDEFIQTLKDILQNKVLIALEKHANSMSIIEYL